MIAACAVVLLTACGGGGSSKSGAGASDTTSDPNATNVTTSAPSGSDGPNGHCFTDPGPQKARVRFVNLYTNAAHPEGDIDVWQGFSGTDACGKKLATVPYGTATDYLDVTASDSSGNWEAVAFIAGSTADDQTIITQTETWKGGEQVTFTILGADPAGGNGPVAGGDQAIFEKSDSGVSESALKVVPGKASIGINGASVQYVDPKGAWRAGVKGQSGCLSADGDSENVNTNIGGTSTVAYTVPPGSETLSLYPSDPGTCTGTADVGPTTFDAAAGSRTLVFVYGSDAQALKLLVLPMAA